jgi:hypothetical protein
LGKSKKRQAKAQRNNFDVKSVVQQKGCWTFFLFACNAKGNINEVLFFALFCYDKTRENLQVNNNIRVVWMIDATKTMDKKEEKNASFVGLNSCQSVDTDVLFKTRFKLLLYG